MTAGSAAAAASEGIPAPPAPVPRPAPSHRRERFQCPSCGRRFEKNVRAGLWSKCPKCGARAYGLVVFQELARAAPQPAPVKPRKRQAEVAGGRRPTVVGSFPAAKPAATTPAPVPSPAAPARAAPVPEEPRRPGFLSRLLGAGDEGD